MGVLSSKFWEGWQFAKGTASASTAAPALYVSHPLESPPSASTHSSRAFTVPSQDTGLPAILRTRSLSHRSLHRSLLVCWGLSPSLPPPWRRLSVTVTRRRSQGHCLGQGPTERTVSDLPLAVPSTDLTTDHYLQEHMFAPCELPSPLGTSSPEQLTAAPSP